MYVYSRTRGEIHLSSVSPCRGEKKKETKEKEKKKKRSAAIAVEQRTLVRHRLTFRNPLASNAGRRSSASAFGGVQGPAASVAAIRQQRNGNAAFSRAERQAHSPFLSNALRMRGRPSVASVPTRGTARERPRCTSRLFLSLSLSRTGSATHAQQILPRVAHCRRNVVHRVGMLPCRTPMATIPPRIVFDASCDWPAVSAAPGTHNFFFGSPFTNLLVSFRYASSTSVFLHSTRLSFLSGHLFRAKSTPSPTSNFKLVCKIEIPSRVMTLRILG